MTNQKNPKTTNKSFKKTEKSQKKQGKKNRKKQKNPKTKSEQKNIIKFATYNKQALYLNIMAKYSIFPYSLSMIDHLA